MSVRFHEKPNGDLGRCRVGERTKTGAIRGCPFKLSDSQHIYAHTLPEARKLHEQKVVAKMANTMTKDKQAEKLDAVCENLNTAAQSSLGVVGEMILNSKANSHKTFTREKGRDTSTSFEKVIGIPLIQRNKSKILRVANEDHKETSIFFTGIYVPETNEKGKRDGADFYYIAESPFFRTPLRLPVNIKYTAGKNKDNVLGKNAFSAIFGYDASGNFDPMVTNSTVSDYLLLTFFHGETKPTSDFHLLSVLHSDPNSKGYAFNGSQSFPLQARVKDVSPSPYGFSLAMNRRAWSLWYAEGNRREAIKKISIAEQAERNAALFS